MKSAALLVAVLSVFAPAEASKSCQEADQEHRVLLQAKLGVFGVECEEMCKRLGEYPNCQCPGFNGEPAEASDTRACMDQHCQDPNQPCPTDAFVTCVKETTKVSALQWDKIMGSVDTYLGLYQKTLGKMRSGTAVAGSSCQESSRKHLALVQAKLALFGIECEEMCKKLGAYPQCECPGFDGEPATDGDTRACYVQHCSDPSIPCPNEPFATCVIETTKISALQFPALLQSFDSTMALYAKGFKALAANHTK